VEARASRVLGLSLFNLRVTAAHAK
jgi:hypothetical protein